MEAHTMDMKSLKQQADDEMKKKEEIKLLQEKVISEFKLFFNVSEKSYSLLNLEMQKTVNRFKEDFKNYFEKEGFSIIETNPPVTPNAITDLNTITKIEASYNNLKFVLSNINYESNKMIFTNSQNITEEIWIALPTETPNYYVWKDNIDNISGKRLLDMNGPPQDIYKNFVYQFSTEEDLNKLSNKININISHFQESINNLKSINLCIHKFGTNQTYNNFQELINSIK